MPDTVRMKRLQQIAYDGINTHAYDVGEEYVVGTMLMPPDIAEALLEDGRAELVRPKNASEHKPQDDEKEKQPPRKGVGPSEIKGN